MYLRAVAVVQRKGKEGEGGKGWRKGEGWRRKTRRGGRRENQKGETWEGREGRKGRKGRGRDQSRRLWKNYPAPPLLLVTNFPISVINTLFKCSEREGAPARPITHRSTLLHIAHTLTLP